MKLATTEGEQRPSMLTDRSPSFDDDAIEAIAESAAAIRDETEPEPKGVQLDVYLFFSFDLAGSTELKKTEHSSSWIDVIRYFYASINQLVNENVSGANLWKRIGDEVLYYKIVTSERDVQHDIPHIYNVLLGFVDLLEGKYADVVKQVSIKSFAWMVPIKTQVAISQLTNEQQAGFAAIDGHYPDDDVRIEIKEADDRTSVDFLGPNIDAGFRIATFARKLQLVLSPGLAKYLVDKKYNVDRMRIVGYRSLKGVAKGKLYPGIWYHENWTKVSRDFTYQDRHGDDLVNKVCYGQIEEIEALNEVCDLLRENGYFFNDADIDEIFRLSRSTI